jgi:hypothetical protein
VAYFKILSQLRVVWKKFADVSEVVSASIIALMMETESTSETSVNFTTLQGATTQKTAIFIVATART